ncbi:tripartite tricarboxylate transporter TctB family protein [Bacillus sp. FJAT-29937]|uniref:tripartite tricarboxylate transporter TctB family protein n=1 Tax=Bacillus sp. FJAT-29937 TaxID=1720553 RepID=UPI000837074D|nr:tripartite tricarboxylate transporter TctB family protein [Bacillus sp. FJAT-29937]
MTHSFDRYAGIIFLLLGVGFITESFKISTSAYGSQVGPNIFPMGLGILLSILSARLIYESVKKKQVKKEKEKLDYKRFLIILIAAIAYCLLLEVVGYVISTFLFLLIGFQAMEKGSWLKTIIISALFSYGVYYLYSELLEGSLPGFPLGGF